VLLLVVPAEVVPAEVVPLVPAAVLPPVPAAVPPAAAPAAPAAAWTILVVVTVRVGRAVGFSATAGRTGAAAAIAAAEAAFKLDWCRV
jgi:hypothetical protein